MALISDILSSRLLLQRLEGMSKVQAKPLSAQILKYNRL